MIPSKITQIKVSQETESEANIGLGFQLYWCLPTLECILRRQLKLLHES